MIRRVAAVLLALALAGCSSSGSSAGDTSTSTQAVDETTSTSEAEATTTLPAAEASELLTPAEAANYVIGVLNGDPLSAEAYEVNFTDAFREALPFSEMQGLIDQLGGAGPWSKGDLAEENGFEGRYDIESPEGDRLFVDVVVQPEGGIAGLYLSPAQEFDAPENSDEAIERLSDAGYVRLVVAEVTDGTCDPLLDLDASVVMPLASAFKLYVLGAVVQAVDDGTITWETPVSIRDELDSLPSGTTQDVEPGTELTVRELAELMISISDNTATDHLIDLVGRDAVEAVLVPMGNDAVGQNQPFPTTRELFVMKFGDGDLGEQFVAADEAGRRELLAGAVAASPLPGLDAYDPSTPRHVDELEWFASPQSICAAMVWLVDDPTALDILTLNPGVPAADGRWNELAYKGGSEPGLAAAVWWTVGDDGRAFVTAGSVMSTTGALDEFEILGLLASIRDNLPAGS